MSNARKNHEVKGMSNISNNGDGMTPWNDAQKREFKRLMRNTRKWARRMKQAAEWRAAGCPKQNRFSE